MKRDVIMITLQIGFIPTLAMMLLFACTTSGENSRELRTRALLTRYETVFVADGSILFKTGRFANITPTVVAKLQMPFADLLDVLTQRKEIREGLVNNAEFVAVGAKNFKGPARLGDVKSDHCFVIKLSSLSLLSPNTSGLEETGVASGIWKVGMEKASTTYYMSMPSREYLLLSNNTKDLVALAEIFKSSAAGNSEAFDFLSHLSSWKQMVESPYWGYRHYSSDSTIHSKQASRALELGPAARSLSLFVNSSSDSARVEFRLDSNANNISSILNDIGPNKFEQVKDGSWQTKIPFTADNETDEMIFNLISMFGFGIYL